MNPNNPPKPTILKDTRVAKGLTLEIVHEATKIPMDALRAIEEGYSVKMLTPFYYKGFVKIYAEFLGLSVDEVFGCYHLDKNITKTPPAIAPVEPKPVRRPITKAQPKTSVVEKPVKQGPNPTIEAIKKIFTPDNLLLLGRVIVVLVLCWGVFKIGGCAINAIKKWPKSAPKSQSAKKDEKKESKKSSPAVKDNDQSTNESKSASAKTTGGQSQERTINAASERDGVELAVRASRDGWVQVKADGQIVFQMTMKKGTMESWKAEDQIELTGKNINELEMEVNGKHVGALGSSERKAKRVIITKEGLTVKK